MKFDRYGQILLTENDICDLLLEDPERSFGPILSEDSIEFNPVLELKKIPNIIGYTDSDYSIDEFDKKCQSNYKMPAQYLKIDVLEYVIDRCKSDEEIIRCCEEFLLYEKYNLLNLLRYMIYLVDLMRKNNIIWGVGRGSSVSSFVLYLIGIHRINSLQYDLSFDEFLK
jgi:DNA polymerase III alpha subunit